MYHSSNLGQDVHTKECSGQRFAPLKSGCLYEPSRIVMTTNLSPSAKGKASLATPTTVLPEHLLSVPFVEVITRHIRIIGSECFDVSLVQNRTKY